MYRPSILALTLALAVTPTLSAQTPSPLSLRLPSSTRALALGSAFPVGSRDSDGVFYNAAFADAIRGLGIHAQRYGRESTLITASGGAEWWGGNVAFGVRSIDYSASFAADSVPAVAERQLRNDGDEGASSLAASISYARRVWRLRAALTASYVVERFGSGRAEGAAFDAALATGFAYGSAGLSVHDIGPGFGAGAHAYELPTRVALRAASRTVPVGPLDVALAATVEHRIADGRTDTGAGAELGWWPIAGRTFTARIGARTAGGDDSPFSFGAGFTGDRIAVDWAWRELGTGGTHRIGLRYR